MELYEFITPSDAITFYAPDNKVAFAVALMLGNGKAGLKRKGAPSDENIPSMLAFSKEPEKTMDEYVGGNFGEWMAKNRKEIANAMKSFAYTDFNNRFVYDKACDGIKDPVELDKFKHDHEDKKRTSMSKWVLSAWKIGDGIIAKLKEADGKH